MTDTPISLGGGTTGAHRVGDTVVRATGPWTPHVHVLMRHLLAAGVPGVPEVLGTGDDTEVLSWLPGAVIHPPVTPELVDDAAVAEGGRMLRRLHDATVGLAADPELRTGWRFEPVEPVEVICHQDFAPYNVVFAAGRPVGVIDFDTARPGPRHWDLGYAVFAWTPLDRRSPLHPDEQWRRVEIMCAAYGTETGDILTFVERRLVEMITAIESHPAFTRQRAEHHDDYYRDCLDWVRTAFTGRV